MNLTPEQVETLVAAANKLGLMADLISLLIFATSALCVCFIIAAVNNK